LVPAPVCPFDKKKRYVALRYNNKNDVSLKFTSHYFYQTEAKPEMKLRLHSLFYTNSPDSAESLYNNAND